MIRVLVADDPPMVRSGIVAMVAEADDLEVVAAVGDGAAAVREAIATAPDVVLMDLRMPVLDGSDATGRTPDGLPRTREIVLTSYDSADATLEPITAGASAYLVKAAPEAEILAGI